MSANGIDLGLVLLDMENWHRATLKPDFEIIDGVQLIEDALGVSGSTNLLDCVDDDNKSSLSGFSLEAEPGRVFSDVFVSKSGKPFELILSRSGNTVYAFFKNMTNRLASLERLAVFYRNFQNTPIAICFTDEFGNIQDANKAFLNLYGYTIGEVIGQNPRILKSGRQSPSAYKEMWEQISDSGKGYWTGELINRRKDGKEISVLLTISSVKRSNGSLIGYIASALDITRQKQLESEIIAYNTELQELSGLKSDLMAITSHDLKAPLNSIISRANMIKELSESMQQEKLLAQVDQIILLGTQMTAFINDLLDQEKYDSGKAQLSTARVHVDEALARCVEMSSVTAAAKKVCISMRTTGRSSPMIADVVKLEQAFNNLLSNAVKFSPAGSVVDVLYSEDQNGNKRIEIADRGQGIPKEDLERIFDRFYQVRKKGSVPGRVFGSGLGLTIVNNVAEMHGGKITATNREGGGSVFILELPDRGPSPSLKNLAVMIHDPASEIFEYAEEYLGNMGVSCFTTKTEHEAIKVLENEVPEVVIVNHGSLSVEMRDLLSEISGTRDGLPVVVDFSGTECNDAMYYMSLTPPVVDVEIYDILVEAQLRSS